MVKFIFLVAIIFCYSTGVLTKTAIDLISDNEEKKIIFFKRAGNTSNPCTIEIPTESNYKVPGRRISVAKCLEFIGDRKIVEDNKKYKNDWLQDRRESLGRSRAGSLGNHQNIGTDILMISQAPNKWILKWNKGIGALGWKSSKGSYKFKCGGSIISPNFMITAAHCTYAVGDSEITSKEPEIVRIGSRDLQTYETYKNTKRLEPEILTEDIRIIKILRHPQYHPPKRYFDIALLELKRKISFDEKIQPACLWDGLNAHTLQKPSACGWGAIQEGSKQIITELSVGELDLINSDKCNELLRPARNRRWNGLEEHQMCAGKLAGRVDTCQGDSGGPLQAQINLNKSIKKKFYYLLGVTSFGFGCGRPNSPGVYTRVASFLDWIEENVWPDEIANKKFN